MLSKLGCCCCCFKWKQRLEDEDEDDFKKKEAQTINVISKENSQPGNERNPRNKCALQPGHSLMDWIRVGASGKDLTGLGSRAGNLPVTKQELAKHNKREDAWLAIRGKVYSITAYFPFHPGGEEELMRGAGIDATDLFNEVHAWVNYEQILQKCLVGRLVSADPALDTEALLFGEKKPFSPPKTISEPNSNQNPRLISPALSTKDSPTRSEEKSTGVLETVTTLPRFDWIQKMDFITVIFYTKAFSNPLVELFPQTKDCKCIAISISYDETIYRNEIIFHKDVNWPSDVKVTVETGKIELVFKKKDGGIWENYGVLKQESKGISTASAVNARSSYVLKKKLQINYNTYLLKFERQDGVKTVIPIGKHVRVFGDLQGQELSRSYTPVPESLFTKFTPHSTTTDLCLLVKKYNSGNLSKYVTEKEVNDTVKISKPIGSFDLRKLEKRETFLLLAAGTGVTPMLSIIMFLLERRIKKCQFVRLLFFNKTEEDILSRNQIEILAEHDNRFQVAHILSNPDGHWKGISGHVSPQIVQDCLQEHLRDTGYTIQDIYSCICGPKGFNTAAYECLLKVGLGQEQIHTFEG